MKERGIFTRPTESSFMSAKEIKKKNSKKLDWITPLPDDKDFSHWSDRFKERQSQYIETKDVLRNNFELNLPERSFVALVGDQHIGSPEVDYERIEAEVQAIIQTENAYMVVLGDTVDGFFFNPAQMEEMEQVPEQYEYIGSMINYLGENNKLILAIGGDHDGWAKKRGFNALKEFTRKNSCFYSEGVTYLTINIGDANYKLTMAHRFPGNSIYNPVHSQTRAIRFGEARGSDIVASGHCFEEEAEILTKTGWRRGLEVEIGEMVGTKNLKTGEFEWNRVKEKYVYDDYKELYHIKNRNLDIKVTDEHTMVVAPVSGGHKKGAFQDYKNNKRWKKEEAKSTALRKAPFYIPLSANQQRDDFNIKDDELRLVGWLVSDGHFRENGSVQLFQNVGKKSEMIKEILKSLDIPFSTYIRNFKGRKFNDPRTGKEYITKEDNETFYITVKNSKKILDLVREKRLPNWVYKLSKRQVDILLNSLILGDGYTKQGAMIYTSADRVLIDQIQALCSINGFRTTINKNYDEICITTNPSVYFNPKITPIKKVPYEGLVWCVTVNNGTLLVRNNGKTLITGNTHKKGIATFNVQEFGGVSQKVYAISVGPYKKNDEYARKLGLGRIESNGLYGAGIILNKDDKKIEAHYDILDGIKKI